MDIRIGQVGRILDGAERGMFVKVIDDAESTGGYLILTATAPDMKEGFDNWVKNRDDLSKYFGESGWQIEWL